MSPLDPNATQTTVGWLPQATALIQWLMAPLLSVVISAIYYKATSTSLSKSDRILVSAHGVSIAAMYFAALSVFWADASKPSYATPFMLSLLLPLALIVTSIFRFCGPRIVHWLQIINCICLAWVAFIGIMAVTGDWL